MDYPSTAKVKTGTRSYMADYQERYTGIKTPKWVKDMLFSKDKSNKITKEEKQKIFDWEKKNKVQPGKMYNQAVEEVQQEKRIAKRTMTSKGTTKPRLSGRGGGGMMSPVKTPADSSRMSMPLKKKMNRGGLIKKGRK